MLSGKILFDLFVNDASVEICESTDSSTLYHNTRRSYRYPRNSQRERSELLEVSPRATIASVVFKGGVIARVINTIDRCYQREPSARFIEELSRGATSR